jgi:hypothetical protein
MMEDNTDRKCGNCGLAVDHSGDAMVYCKHLKIRVLKASMPCANWCDETVF